MKDLERCKSINLQHYDHAEALLVRHSGLHVFSIGAASTSVLKVMDKWQTEAYREREGEPIVILSRNSEARR